MTGIKSGWIVCRELPAGARRRDAVRRYSPSSSQLKVSRTSRCDRLPRVTGEACYSALSGRQGQSGCHSLQQQEWYRGSNCLRLFLRNRRRGFFYCEAAKLRHSACQRARRSPFSADGKEYVNRAYAVLKEGAANCSPIGHVTIAPCRFTLVEDFQTPTRKDRIIS